LSPAVNTVPSISSSRAAVIESSRVSQSPMSPAPTRTATAAGDALVAGDGPDGDAGDDVAPGVALALGAADAVASEVGPSVGPAVGPPLPLIRTDAIAMSRTIVTTTTSAPTATAAERVGRLGASGGFPVMRPPA
jgi:hypothetical protein